MSKIIQLKSENVKRLVAVEIKPDGNMVVIGGKNGQGKTSVLDSIMYALAGAKSLPKVPVRQGEEKATVELDLGDIVVKRTFAASGGTTLVVTNKEGLRYPSPQAILDALVGRLSFDPLDFARQDSRQQSETLRALLGLDFSKHEQERQKLYNDRTIVNREVASLESRLAILPQPIAGLPEAEVPTASILADQRAASAKNSENERKRTDAERLSAAADRAESLVVSAQSDVQRLSIQLESLKQNAIKLQSNAKSERQKADAAAKSIAELKDTDLLGYAERLQAVEKANRLVRQQNERAELAEQVKSKRQDKDSLTAKIEAIDAAKVKAIGSAKFPIAGLGFDEAGDVTFGGLPLGQAASAEQLRVSIAIGLALNPKLRVLLIRDGSLLDDESLKLVADAAQKADAQVWLERVGQDGNVSVVIEDGMLKV